MPSTLYFEWRYIYTLVNRRSAMSSGIFGMKSLRSA